LCPFSSRRSSARLVVVSAERKRRREDEEEEKKGEEDVSPTSHQMPGGWFTPPSLLVCVPPPPPFFPHRGSSPPFRGRKGGPHSNLWLFPAGHNLPKGGHHRTTLLGAQHLKPSSAKSGVPSPNCPYRPGDPLFIGHPPIPGENSSPGFCVTPPPAHQRGSWISTPKPGKSLNRGYPPTGWEINRPWGEVRNKVTLGEPRLDHPPFKRN